MDFIVLLLAFFALCFWIVGQLYLAFYPVPEGAALADNGKLEKDTPGLVKENSDSPNSGSPSSPNSDGEAKGQDPADQNSGDQAGDGQNPRAENADPTEPGLESNNMQAVDVEKVKTEIQAEVQAEWEQKYAAAKQELEADFSSRINNAVAAQANLKQGYETKIQSLQAQLKTAETTAQMAPNSEQLLLQKDNSINELNQKIAQMTEQQNQLALNSTPSQTSPEMDKPALAPAVFRQWEGVNGKKVEMAFIRWDGNQIVFADKANRVFALPPERLGAQDRALVESIK